MTRRKAGASISRTHRQNTLQATYVITQLVIPLKSEKCTPTVKRVPE